MSEIEIGDRVEIWSKHVQNWIRGDVLGMRDGKITVTYEIQGITYRKKVHINDETAIRFRNGGNVTKRERARFAHHHLSSKLPNEEYSHFKYDNIERCIQK